MNQILITKLSRRKSKRKQLITQFIISVIGLFVLFLMYLIYIIQQNKNKLCSEYISKNYQIYKLYSTSSFNDRKFKDSDIIGNIIIPKINLNYPIFYGISNELLKLAPCKFDGKMPPDIGNLCIAGHNYNDERFFSNISLLDLKDLIIIENDNKNKFYYYVYDIFELAENKLNNINRYTQNSLELTLVTCNNSNGNRIIIKAKTEGLY